jgi:hypothetical protein
VKNVLFVHGEGGQNEGRGEQQECFQGLSEEPYQATGATCAGRGSLVGAKAKPTGK